MRILAIIYLGMAGCMRVYCPYPIRLGYKYFSEIILHPLVPLPFRPSYISPACALSVLARASVPAPSGKYLRSQYLLHLYRSGLMSLHFEGGPDRI